MGFMRRLLETEPAVTIGFIGAGLTMLILFGVQLSNDQLDSVLKFAASALVFLSAIFGIRQSVYSQKTVTEMTTTGGQ